MADFYHQGNRDLQNRFDSVRIADRLVDVRLHSTFDDTDCDIVDNAPFFILATVTPDGQPDCSFKGGLPGFVRIRDSETLEFPDYDGNGMFKSLGNIQTNPRVALLFYEVTGKNRRLRIHGEATLVDDVETLREHHGGKLVVRVKPKYIFPNCPRYIPTAVELEHSKYSPRPGYDPPEPAWKSKPDLRDYVTKPQSNKEDSK